MRNKGKKFEWYEKAQEAFENKKNSISLLDKTVQVTSEVMRMRGGLFREK